jgi:BON domain-containing protein
VVGAIVVIDVLNKGRVERHRNDNPPPSPAAARSESADGDAGAARDAQIQTGVQRALRSSPRTRRADIDVEVDEGFVTLTGNAPAAAAHEAEALARHVDGVREVVNAISIEGGEEAGGTAVPVPPIAPPAPGPGDGPHGPVLVPHGPHGRPAADPEAVRRLLQEARDAMRAGNAGEAMAKFGAVMQLDPQNVEAREGLKDATILLGETIRRRVMPSPGP